MHMVHMVRVWRPLPSGSGRQTRTTGTQRVTQCDGTPVGIHAGIVIGQTQLARDCQRLGGKGFV